MQRKSFDSSSRGRRTVRNARARALATHLALPICLLFAATSCGKAPSASTTRAAGKPAAAERPSRSSGTIDAASLLTKEEVSAIIGTPVTSLLSSGGQASVTYKTADPMIEAGLEAERKSDTADALETMAGARKATGLLGGTPEAAAGLGDDAFYGAFSVLYLRAGDVVLTITPPNLKQAAQMQAYNKMTAAPDAASQKKAMDDLAASMKNDPLLAGNSERDPAKAAVDVVQASSKPQGTEYEAKARAMAREMGLKALVKLGAAHA